MKPGFNRIRPRLISYEAMECEYPIDMENI